MVDAAASTICKRGGESLGELGESLGRVWGEFGASLGRVWGVTLRRHAWLRCAEMCGKATDDFVLDAFWSAKRLRRLEWVKPRVDFSVILRQARWSGFRGQPCVRNPPLPQLGFGRRLGKGSDRRPICCWQRFFVRWGR